MLLAGCWQNQKEGKAPGGLRGEGAGRTNCWLPLKLARQRTIAPITSHLSVSARYPCLFSHFALSLSLSPYLVPSLPRPSFSPLLLWSRVTFYVRVRQNRDRHDLPVLYELFFHVTVPHSSTNVHTHLSYISIWILRGIGGTHELGAVSGLRKCHCDA